uniref:Putative mannose-binding lectin n=1 Tax=Wolffia australiana TaxID=161112 RepID=G0YLW5_WOLAU|nr:putative mannose-binding lectin [Wolffia australiana]
MAKVLVACVPQLLLLALLPSACLARTTLSSGESLNAPHSLHTGNYVFTMQNDCNLVLYDRDRAVWSTRTHGQGQQCRATMQSDGNFVVYDNRNRALWASGTHRPTSGFYILTLQADRNVVIYHAGRATWATGTHVFGTGVTIVPQNNANATAVSTP